MTRTNYIINKGLGGGYGVLHHFQQYFSYIVTVSFIGGGNRTTRRKPPTCRKPLTNFIIYIVVLKKFHVWFLL